jgi:hypothetical protein
MNKLLLYNDSVKHDYLLLNSIHDDIQRLYVTQDTSASQVLTDFSFGSLEYLGVLFHYQGNNFVPFFNDNHIVRYIDKEINDNKNELQFKEQSYSSFSDTFVDFLKIIRQLRGASFIMDILSCDFNSYQFKLDAEELEKELDIVIRYSVDQKGNSPNGNWIMESHNINVKYLYFTEKINEWNGILSDEIKADQLLDLTVNGNNVFSKSVNGDITTYRLLQDINWDTNLLSNLFINLPQFNIGVGFSSVVNTINIDSSGNYIVGGNFTSYNGDTTGASRIIRLLPDGSRDTNFVIGTGFNNGSVNTINIDSSDNYIVGGNFTSYNGDTTGASRIIRLLPDGSRDTNFVIGTGFNSLFVRTIIIDSSGNYIVGGEFTSYNNINRSRIARINSNGDIDVNILNAFILLDSSNVIFDGQGHTITIPSGNINYSGLFIPSIRTGTNTDNPVIIRNLLINNYRNLISPGGGIVRGTPFTGNPNTNPQRRVFNVENCSYHQIAGTWGNFVGGIVGQRTGGYNGKCVVKNCYSIGNISGSSSGGICGPFTGENNGLCTIQNCYSIGNISGSFSGGICGQFTGENNGLCTIQNCYSTGIISGSSSGGICGSFTGVNNGLCTIQNCYSTGIISGSSSGGICGSSSGENNGLCTIQNCYSTGIISGSSSGGICGSSSGENNGLCTIQNCYSTGIISGSSSGGICGSSTGVNNGLCTIQNCYSTGNISGFSSGGIVGNNIVNCIIQNCYSINGGSNPNNPATYTSGFANGNFNINDISFGLVNNLIDSSNVSLNDGSANTIILDNSYGIIRVGSSNNIYYAEVRNNNNGLDGYIATFNNFPRLYAFQRIPWNNSNYQIHDTSGIYIRDLSQLITQSIDETNNNKNLNKLNVQTYYGLLNSIRTNNQLIGNVLQEGSVTKNNIDYFLLYYNNIVNVSIVDLQNIALLIDSITKNTFILNIDNLIYEIIYDPNDNTLEINNIKYTYTENPKTRFTINNKIFEIVARGSLVLELIIEKEVPKFIINKKDLLYPANRRIISLFRHLTRETKAGTNYKPLHKNLSSGEYNKLRIIKNFSKS